jgi:hypothetical protein
MHSDRRFVDLLQEAQGVGIVDQETAGQLRDLWFSQPSEIRATCLHCGHVLGGFAVLDGAGTADDPFDDGDWWHEVPSGSVRTCRAASRHLDPEPILYPHKQMASPDPRSIRKGLDPVEVP